MVVRSLLRLPFEAWGGAGIHFGGQDN